MFIRKCPECNNRISLYKTINLCPSKTYSCPHCSTKLTVSERSHHILLFGALFILVPALVYCIFEPSLISGVVVGLAFLFLVVLTIVTQKVVPVKTI